MGTIQVIVTGTPGQENKGGFKSRVGNVPCLGDINCIQKVAGGAVQNTYGINR